MAGRVEYRAGRHLGGTACVLLMSAVVGLGVAPRASAQEMSGAPIALDAAGNGTGDAVAAFDPSAAGIHAAGQGASLLASLNDGPPPFDISSTRRRPNAGQSAALAMQASPSAPAFAPAAPLDPAQPMGPAAALEPAQPLKPLPATQIPGTPSSAPSIGEGAPGLGAGTPGTASPTISTPTGGAPAVSTVPLPSTVGAGPATAAVPKFLADLLANHLGRFLSRPNEAQALADFYAARGYQPAFTASAGLSPLGIAAVLQFTSAAQEGLSPGDYAVPALSARPSDMELAETELRMAVATLLYARHAQSGRFDPTRISAFVDPTPTVPAPAAILAAVSSASNPRAAFASFAPQYDEYRLLKLQLARLLAEGRGTVHAPIPLGPTIRPGESDDRVPLLRARLGVAGGRDNYRYDEALVEAVRAFQQSAGMNDDGIVGRGTLALLNDSGGDQLADVIANMERWRWLPHEVAPVYVMVNIPEFMVRVITNEQTIHETRVVVGTEKNQTPILSHEMEYIVFNPSWNLPPGIIRNEMLPKLQSDPYALDRQGIDVVRNGRIIDPGTVDWSRGTQGYSFRQPPGERNALGRMKFMFPNKHSVYLHDTPSRALFARERRAFSHGCVRVHEPLKFAEVMFSLGIKEPWSGKRIAGLLGGNEKYVNLQKRFPVHLVYFTSYVDGSGELVTREDLYGTNAAVKSILGIDGPRRMADRGGLAPAR